MSSKREMFRPSFTLAELQELNSYVPQESTLKRKIGVYLFKVEVGLNAAAYVSPSKEAGTIEAKLGLIDMDTGGKSQAELYQERLAKKQELAPATLSKEERFEILAAKSFNGELTLDEAAEGRALEQELYGMDMGTFPAA